MDNPHCDLDFGSLDFLNDEYTWPNRRAYLSFVTKYVFGRWLVVVRS